MVSAAAGALKATMGLGFTIQATGLLLFASAMLLLGVRPVPRVGTSAESLSPTTTEITVNEFHCGYRGLKEWQFWFGCIMGS
jgi:hypothetical protein